MKKVNSKCEIVNKVEIKNRANKSLNQKIMIAQRISLNKQEIRVITKRVEIHIKKIYFKLAKIIRKKFSKVVKAFKI